MRVCPKAILLTANSHIGAVHFFTSNEAYGGKDNREACIIAINLFYDMLSNLRKTRFLIIYIYVHDIQFTLFYCRLQTRMMHD